ncbi:hypothetical protein SAMN04489712_104526 [Thermomonospora echinospora]|uniref:Uncharacterized protein n=1 Tax=Thermomonospora echinospora TaxID=1992 RepID=A0A1H5ZGV9_9ACTN|nr:hypothetical protein SAMN04489712_104526 [Thermomonospora echinospora]
MGFALQYSIALAQAREMVGVAAALLLAALAAYAGWHVTDRLVALRQRPDED